jgi:hypothetical protein
MRRFIAKTVLAIVAAARTAWLCFVVVLAVLLPCVMLVAAYIDPVTRIAFLLLALMACVVYLLEGVSKHIYDWAERVGDET